MKVLILGGNSKRHYDWIRQLDSALDSYGHGVVLHDYIHWSNDRPAADIEQEIIAIQEAVDGIEDYVIVAKSIGTVIATLAIARGILAPYRVVFLGVPYQGIAGEVAEFTPSLKRLPFTVFIQNQYDPYGNAEGLKDILKDNHPSEFKIVVVDGNTTHDYLDFELINKELIQ